MKLIYLLSSLIGLLLLASVTFSNHSLDYSTQVVELSREVAALSHDVTILESQVADAGSLTKIAEVAKNAGYTTTPHVAVAGPASIASR